MAKCGNKVFQPFKPPRYNSNINVTLNDETFHIITDPETKKMTTVTKFTWANPFMAVEVMTYGATIMSIKIPSNRQDQKDDIVLGFSNYEDYLAPENKYFGATLGRCANRIGKAALKINDNIFRLSANTPPHHYNGGVKGFDKVNWSHYVEEKRVVMSYVSNDNEEGYPGCVLVTAFFELTDNNEFIIEYRAFSTKPTCVNITNHTFFNLAGHDKGSEELYKHSFCINAEYTSQTNCDNVTTGNFTSVIDTPLDFRTANILENVIEDVGKGFDHNFCITKGEYQQETFVARVVHPPTGRVLEIYSNQPGVHFSTANNFPKIPDPEKKQKKAEVIVGKFDARYNKHGAFCLQAQMLPEAINFPEKFSDAILVPGDIYCHTLRYTFSVLKYK